ncbi:MAG: SDR family oxidoreductase [Dehalococcoidia bacterium]|nr:SDR family oxidoreductase [Dehalococcoidia bacterium]
MDLQLAGKTVIVTGGASNIGRAIALGFAREGSNVVIADIDESQAQKVASQANALGGGGRTIVVRADVTSYQEVAAMVARAIDEFDHMHVLVNNVGWVLDSLFLDQPREDWEKAVNLNLWSVMNCMRAALPHMVENGYGRVVSISSEGGRVGEYREAVYAACKAGVIGLTKSLAREMGRYGITLNSVCPAVTIPRSEDEMGEHSLWKTMLQVFTPEMQEKAARLYPLRRLGTAEDTANAVLFLASDVANYITGQSLSVGGGFTMI